MMSSIYTLCGIIAVTGIVMGMIWGVIWGVIWLLN